MMFYYYKSHVPTEYLKEKFSLEHIFPNSSSWSSGEQMDKDRTGNLVPILASMNSSRSNHHIQSYFKNDFRKFIDNVLPSVSEYDSIISHEKAPHIYNISKYNTFCDKNEQVYMTNFINMLFE